MNRKAKAKRQKAVFRNKVIIIGLAAIFAAVFVFLMARGMFTSHAEDGSGNADATFSQTTATNSGNEAVVSKYVNNLDEFSKDVDKDKPWIRNKTYNETLGTPENPFLVLEIVPSNLDVYFAYNIDGCQPFNVAKLTQSKNGTIPANLNGNLFGQFLGSDAHKVTDIFDFEYDYNLARYGDKNPNATACFNYFDKDNWKKQVDKKAAYYEKVTNGTGDYSLNSKGAFEKSNNGDFKYVVTDKDSYTAAVNEKKEAFERKKEELNKLKVYYSSEFPNTDGNYNIGDRFYKRIRKTTIHSWEPNKEIVYYVWEYYERVKDGTGQYILNGSDSFEKSDNGNFKKVDLGGNEYYAADGRNDVENSQKQLKQKKDEINNLNVYYSSDYPNKNNRYKDGDRYYCFEENEKEATYSGYYEKVDNGTGYFNLNGDVFNFVGQNNGNFIWTTLSNTNEVDPYNSVSRNSNFYSNKKPNSSNNYKVGDRFYTTCTHKGYYSIYNDDNNGNRAVAVYENSFFTEALGLRGKDEIENYSVVYKCIQPSELNNESAWIDEADFIYLHDSQEGGAGEGNVFNTVRDLEKKGLIKDEIKMTSLTTASEKNKFDDTDVNNQNYYKYDKNNLNDISFECAVKLFKKVNKLGEYENKSDDKLSNYSPLLMPKTLLDNPPKGSTKDLKNCKHINLDTLELSDNGNTWSGTGSNSNIYKFIIMNFLRKPERFYQSFFENERQSGGKVIETDTDGIGIITPYYKSDASEYWNILSFMPDTINNKGNSFIGYDGDVQYAGLLVDESKPTLGNYEYYYANYWIFTKMNQALVNSCFLYNGDDIFKDHGGITGNSGLSYGYDDINNWYKEYDQTTYAGGGYTYTRIFEYLLKYKRNSNNSKIDPDGKTTFNVLEIEPCNDFEMNKTTLSSYLPASTYGGKFKFTYMTAEEFNGSKKNLSDFDMVYIGDNNRKYNTGKTTNSDAKDNVILYNDKNITKHEVDNKPIKGYSYIHTGDEYVTTNGKHIRTSGNDITSIKKNKLDNYSKEGNIVVVKNRIYKTFVTYDKDLQKKNSINTFDPKSNIYGFLNSNVSINRLGDFYSPALLKKFEEHIKSLLERSAKVTNFPEENSSIDNYKITFNFKAGSSNKKTTQYRVRLFVDKNNNGVIDESSKVKDNVTPDLVYDSRINKISETDGIIVNGGEEDNKGYLYYTSGASGKLTYDLHSIRDYLSSGPVVWKFVVYNDGLESDKYEKTGKFTVEDPENLFGSKDVVNVLQIVDDEHFDSDSNLENVLDLKSDDYKFYKYTNGKNSRFNKLVGKINVKTVKLSDFASKIKDKASEGYDEFTTSDNETYFYPSQDGDDDFNIWDKSGNHRYNVLLVSCGNKIFKDYKNVSAYIRYASQNGAGIVFTGNAFDSSDNDPKIKELLGINRSNADDFALDSKDNVKLGQDDDYYSVLDYTYGKAISIEDSESNSYKNYKNFTGSGVNKDGWNAIFGSGKKAVTNQITSINQGKVTSYPYEINDHLNINPRSSEDYQLYLENPDITVWYCLAGDYYDDTKFTGTAANASVDSREDKTMYDIWFTNSRKWTHSTYGISPNDAVNNYYMYTYKNLIFDGINLDKFTGNDSSSENDQEMKLFINALVNASQTKAQIPSIKIVNNENIKSGKEVIPELLTEDEFDIVSPKFSGDKEPDSKFEYYLSVGKMKTTVRNPYEEYSTDNSIKEKEGTDPDVKETSVPVTAAPDDKVIDGKTDNSSDDSNTSGSSGGKKIISSDPDVIPVTSGSDYTESVKNAVKGKNSGIIDLSKYKSKSGYYMFEFRQSSSSNIFVSKKNAVVTLLDYPDGNNKFTVNYDKSSNIEDGVISSDIGSILPDESSDKAAVNDNSTVNSQNGSELQKDEYIHYYYVNADRINNLIKSDTDARIVVAIEKGFELTGVKFFNNTAQLDSYIDLTSKSDVNESGEIIDSGSSAVTSKIVRTNISPLFNGTVKGNDGKDINIIDDLLYNGKNSTYSSLEGIQKAGVKTTGKITDKMFKGINTVGYANKIYFKPIDGTLSSMEIKKLKISLTNVSTSTSVEWDSDKAKSVNEVFYQVPKIHGSGYNVYRYDADDNGMFSTVDSANKNKAEKNNLLSDRVYYLLYNPDTTYNTLKFEIWNDYGYSVAYMRFIVKPSETEESNTVYLFNLD